MKLAHLPAGPRFLAGNVIAGILGLGASVLGGHVRLGVLVLVGMAALGLLGLVPGELMRTSRYRADERQRMLFVGALVVSEQVVRLVLFVGVLTELYRGAPGPFLLIAVVSSVAEIVTLLVAPRKSWQ